MSSKIEVEAKFFLKENSTFFELIKKNNFKKMDEVYEEDFYFSDIHSNYIKNRTCLRIRKNNNNFMELTFKGKSNINQEFYAKKENNILVDSKDFNELVGFLSDLGYYIYVTVKKNRIIYSKTQDNLVYNIMIDRISNVGEFVEFEILCNEETKSIDILKQKLDAFIDIFNNNNKLETASLPYRDFVAQMYSKKINHGKNKKVLLLDFDGTLVNSEKEFFKAFRDVILEKYNYEISNEEYKKNELDKNSNLIKMLKNKGIIETIIDEQNIMKLVYQKYDSYFKNVLEDKDTIVNVELLKQLKEKGYRICIVSTSKKKYIDTIINELKLNGVIEHIVSREDVKNLKPDKEAYEKLINQLKVNPVECLAVEDSNRGIESAIGAGLDVIKVDGFSLLKDENNMVFNLNSFSELALILLNN